MISLYSVSHICINVTYITRFNNLQLHEALIVNFPEVSHLHASLYYFLWKRLSSNSYTHIFLISSSPVMDGKAYSHADLCSPCPALLISYSFY